MEGYLYKNSLLILCMFKNYIVLLFKRKNSELIRELS
jgi:hypothetical protein